MNPITHLTRQEIERRANLTRTALIGVLTQAERRRMMVEDVYVGRHSLRGLFVDEVS